MLPSKFPVWKLGLLTEEVVYPHSMAYLCDHQLESLSDSTITRPHSPLFLFGCQIILVSSLFPWLVSLNTLRSSFGYLSSVTNLIISLAHICIQYCI